MPASTTSPFPPAKTDDEIAALVEQMGAELGVPRRTAASRPRAKARPTALELMRARARPSSAPPAVPDWAHGRAR